ncbi:alpha-galactosidase agla [Corynespora cassiicola Philippines]|uniref:Alpha-galactosidase n=1 Tax=Corynespora cassiicola Philippines TaxID=1448308 RepID=A0A2T2N6H5_CORCC|nr:alpha-galactosidase agla [Corynespora cassiicola Philippines]
METLSVFIFAAMLGSSIASVQEPTISPRPPMGFNNWARFMCNLNETLFTTTVDAMLSKGLLAAGYNNINLDDCWSLKERSVNGELEWNPSLFPHGMPWLANYFHDRGFSFGIYTNAGNMTCGLYPGSQDHEEIDSLTFERWGVDYLKLDACHMDLQNGRTYYEEFAYRYQLWHEILTTKLQKPFIFSQSAPAYFSPNFHLDKNNTEWYRTMEYVRRNGELARHSDDVKVYGNNPTNTFEPGGHWDSIMNNYGMEVRLARYQSCGFFNDPDFLIPDWPDLSLDEKKTHFSLWSAFSAPLIISAHIPDLGVDDIAYLTNRDVIAVDQDALCEQATLVSQDEWFDVLAKNLANGDRLVVVLNRGEELNRTSVAVERLGVDPAGRYRLRDLWSGETRAVRGRVEVRLRAHQTAIYRLSGEKGMGLDVTPTGQIFNTFSLNCLDASHSGSVDFGACSGSDGQVWTVSKCGFVSPLSDKRRCLGIGTSGGVELKWCRRDDKSQQWKYGVSGNLRVGGKCLEELSGRAVIKTCGVALDSQVVALPGGIDLDEW